MPPRQSTTHVHGPERGGGGPAFLSLPVVRKIRFRQLDLTGSRLPDWTLRNVEIADCRFDEAMLHDWAIFGGTVSDTSFRGTDLRGSNVGKGTIYRSCSFEETDFRKTSSTAVTFEDCSFVRANLKDVEFPDSRFVRCRFAGLIDGTSFGGEAPPDALDGTDFGDSELKLVDLRKLNLRGIVPPRHPNNVVVYRIRSVLERLEAEVAGSPDHPMAWMQMKRQIWAMTGPEQDVGIFHLAELSPTKNLEAGEPAAEVLRRLERECMGSATGGAS